MSLLVPLTSFFVANEVVVVVTVVAATLVLFQLALLASAFLSETAVSTSSGQAVASTDDNVDVVGQDEETADFYNEHDVWAAYAYMPYMF